MMSKKKLGWLHTVKTNSAYKLIQWNLGMQSGLLNPADSMQSSTELHTCDYKLQQNSIFCKAYVYAYGAISTLSLGYWLGCF